MIKAFQFLFLGMIMGVANIMPGISGGMIAAISGKYYEILESASQLMSFKFEKKYVFTLLPVLVGMFVSIIAFANIISYLLNSYAGYLIGLFVGLIIGGVIYLKKIVNFKPNLNKVMFLIFLISFILLFIFVVPKENTTLTNGIGKDTIKPWWYLMISGALGISAMTMPAGIDGSSVLLILGVYKIAIDSIKTFNFGVIIPIAAGMLIGFVFIVKLLTKLMEKNKDLIMSCFMGIMLSGCFNIIYVNFSVFNNIFVYVFIGIGIFLGYIFENAFN